MTDIFMTGTITHTPDGVRVNTKTKGTDGKIIRLVTAEMARNAGRHSAQAVELQKRLDAQRDEVKRLTKARDAERRKVLDASKPAEVSARQMIWATVYCIASTIGDGITKAARFIADSFRIPVKAAARVFRGIGRFLRADSHMPFGGLIAFLGIAAMIAALAVVIGVGGAVL